ncbi:MAG TPA: hypothetical protein VFY71_12830 [Planctomycetota bacterium]|nr:hypothetical protein [Planctomycetota bacterium]
MLQLRLRLEKGPRSVGRLHAPQRLETVEYPRVRSRAGVAEIRAACAIKGCKGEAVASLEQQAPFGAPAIGHGICTKCGATYAMELS